MRLTKFAAFLLAVVLVSVTASAGTAVLGSALNSSLHITDTAAAERNPPASASTGGPAALAGAPGQLYMPIILLSVPTAIGCITTTNGITGADSGICTGNVTLQLAAGGEVSNGTHTFGLRVNSSVGDPGSASLYGQQGGGSGMTAGGPAGVWGDSAANYGVLGTSGTFPGVTGLSTSNDGARGFSTNGNGVFGRQGNGSGTTPGGPAGVWGDSAANFGVVGTSGTFPGVLGLSASNDGVRGFSTSGNGVFGRQGNGSGFTPGTTVGVWGGGGGTAARSGCWGAATGTGAA